MVGEARFSLLILGKPGMGHEANGRQYVMYCHVMYDSSPKNVRMATVVN